MFTEVSFRSSKSSSRLGTYKDKVLLILEASKVQLLIPTKLTPSWLPSYSSLLCKTFKGLLFELSAYPNSSNNIIDIDKFFFLSFIN